MIFSPMHFLVGENTLAGDIKTKAWKSLCRFVYLSANTRNGDSDSQAFFIGLNKMGNIRKRNKLVFGVGINDADYVVYERRFVHGKTVYSWTCPIYSCWVGMLERCYSESCKKMQPTYELCTCSDQWKIFSNFRNWVIAQEWDDMDLDKDLLFPGNKHYSEKTCIFIPGRINSFLTDRKKKVGNLPTGVSFDPRTKKYRAKCMNPFLMKSESLGAFTAPEKAHEAWRRAKHNHSCRYADQQKDQRIAEALRARYLPGSEYMKWAY